MVALTVFAGPVSRLTDDIAEQITNPAPYVQAVLVEQEGAR